VAEHVVRVKHFWSSSRLGNSLEEDDIIVFLELLHDDCVMLLNVTQTENTADVLHLTQAVLAGEKEK